MTLDTAHSREVYQGNSSATTFPFFFTVWDAAQVAVTVTDAAGASADVTAQCAITLTDGGGSVRYLHENAPLPDGWKLAITRNMPFTQGVDLVSASRFDPRVIEDALDQATAERQQLAERLARAVVVETTSSLTPEDLVQSLYAARDTAKAAGSAAGQSAAQAANSADEAGAAAGAATAEAGRAQAEADRAKNEAGRAAALTGLERTDRVDTESSTVVASATAVKTAYDAAVEASSAAREARATALAAQAAATQAAEAATASLKKTRTSTGDWTLTDLIPRKPVFVTIHHNNTGTSPAGAKLFVTSGSVDGQASRTAPAGYCLGHVNGSQSAWGTVLIPTERTVVIRVESINPGTVCRAYQ